MTMRAQLRGFAWVYALFLVVASAQTAIGALHGQHGGVPVAVLAGVEILAATLFLVPATQVAATATLLAIFAIAAVLTALSGDLPARFAYYAVTALIIVSFNGRLKQMEAPIA